MTHVCTHAQHAEPCWTNLVTVPKATPLLLSHVQPPWAPWVSASAHRSPRPWGPDCQSFREHGRNHRLSSQPGQKGTCRTPPPMTAAGVLCPQHPAPSGQCGLISRSKALGSYPQAGSPFPTQHPSRLDSPYPLAPGHAWVFLHFSPSPSLGTYQGPSLLVASCSHPRPSSSHNTHTPHTPPPLCSQAGALVSF